MRLLSLLLWLCSFSQSSQALRNEDWKTDYHIRYKIRDFLGKFKASDTPTASRQSRNLRVGLLDSGISVAFKNQHPSIQAIDFTNENDPFDSSGHGTFSMSVC
jgi:hypothetical protein